jgi:hypothetical protein
MFARERHCEPGKSFQSKIDGRAAVAASGLLYSPFGFLST